MPVEPQHAPPAPLDGEPPDGLGRTTAPVTRSRHVRADGAPDELPGEGCVVDGKYRIERVLGSGGMGVVMAALHLEIGQRVALKFVRTERRDDVVARLRREARIMFRLRSPHVARLLDVGSLPSGAPFLVLEHLEGEDLARALADRGPLPVGEAVGFVLQACAGLAEAHRLGVVHRDLKPSNLFLTRGADESPLVKVLDFGVAKALEIAPDMGEAVTTTGAGILGTPLYMSPEQVRGGKGVDGRSDVWSMGVILYELIAGRPPFASGPASAVCAAIAADEPAALSSLRAEVPPGLDAAVSRCLAKDPAKRFPTMAALAEALAPFAVAPPLTGDVAGRTAPRARVAWIAASAVGCALCVVAASSVVRGDRPASGAPSADVEAASPPAASAPVEVAPRSLATASAAERDEAPIPPASAEAPAPEPASAAAEAASARPIERAAPPSAKPRAAAPAARASAAPAASAPPLGAAELEERAMSRRR